MIRTAAVVALLALAVCACAQDIAVPLEPGAWTPTPGWTPLTAAEEHSHTLEDGIATFRASGGGATMIWLQSLEGGPLSGIRYLSIRYRAEDIGPNLPSYFIWGDEGDESATKRENFLIYAEELIVDGDWHVLTAGVQLPRLARLALRFAGTEGRVGTLQIDWMRLSAEQPRFEIATSLPWQATDAPVRPIALDGVRNLDLPGVQQTLALADWFDAPAVEVAGARFEAPAEGPIALATPRDEDTAVEIPIGMAAPEIHLLMGGQLAPKLLGYHGYLNGDRIFRPSQFLVTLHYSDGSSFEQIPWCVDRRGFGVWRGLHAYALLADPAKTIERMTFYDGDESNSYLLIAASAADNRLMPELPGDAKLVPAGETPAPVQLRVERDGDTLTVRTTGGTLTFDLAAGAALTAITNGYYYDRAVATAPRPLFRVTEEFAHWDADAFELASCDVADAGATLRFRSDDARAEVTVTIAAGSDGEAELGLQVRNLAEEPRRLNIETGRIAVTGDDLWYFYPRLGVIHTNLDRNLRESQDGYFPTQVMDVYDRTSGGGVSLMTRDRTGIYRQYVLSKKGNEVRQSVEFREANFAPGEAREFPSVYLGVHPGDWHAPWQRYRDWLATWMEPMKPREEWFRSVWNFRTSWLKYFAGDKWYDAETETYLTEERLTRDNELFGPVDMNHFFDWRYSDEFGRWGDYNHYDEFGGLEKFRDMVAYHQEHGTRVGLYMDVFLCSKLSRIGQAHGEEWAVQRQDGSFPGGYSTPEDPLWNMCQWHPGWQEYLSTRAADVARETGADGIYLDEGGTDLGQYWCWRDDHPHEVPACSPNGFLELCRMTKSKLPEGVVLYTEHAPADIVIPYIDGGYVTALGRSDAEITPGYVHIHRFAFPDFKLLPITSAGSLSHGIWDGLRYSVFNGAALYSLSWGHEDEAFELIRKAQAVLREHEDAFLTDRPEMFVPTLAEEVYCNAFPGANETVWTFWNGRFQQFEGPVLAVPHVEGATYRDLWTGEELTPRIEDGQAIIEQTLGARNIGVVAQIR